MEYVPSSRQSFCSIPRICNLIPESFTSANLKQAETGSTIRFHYAFLVQGIFEDLQTMTQLTIIRICTLCAFENWITIFMLKKTYHSSDACLGKWRQMKGS